MPNPVRLHLDESVPVSVAQALRLRGIDISTPRESGLLAATDLAHVAFALAEGRAIVTQDADFLALHKSGVEHAGIIYCQQQSRTIGQIVRSLAQICELCGADDLIARVEFI